MEPADSRLPAAPAHTEDLALVAEMTGDFARSRDIEETLRRGLRRIADRVGAEAASLFLMEGEELVCHACVGPADVTGLRLARGRGIVWRTVTENAPQMVRDTRRDPDFAGTIDQATGFNTYSVLCAPLSVRDERLGAIELFNKKGGASFLAGDRRLLQALASSAALALINARMAAAMAEQEALRRELALAADIQRAMLPGPQPPGSPVHGINVAARGVSGDFFEILPLVGGRIAFAVADVSGKGMNAALLMAKTASLFRCLAKRVEGPGRLLAAIDAELNETGHAGMFVTMVAGVYDPAAGRVVLANAGHEPPLLARDGRFEPVEGGLPPLGILPELFAGGCPESIIDLNGGMLYLFTDGLTEAKGEDGAMLGEAGVRELLNRHAGLPAALRLATVVDAIAGDGVPLRDDLTMLVVEGPRTGAAGLVVEGPRTGAAGFGQRFPARPEALAAIRAAVLAEARRLGCDDAQARDVVLAVDEACQNVIRHGYGADGSGDVVLRMECQGETLAVELVDFAPPVDPATVRPRALDDLRPGGLGTHFMRTVMDDVAFLPPPAGAGNLLRMSKRIGRP